MNIFLSKMLWKAALTRGLDISLRVPPLFFMDTILNKKLFSSYYPYDSLQSSMDVVQWLLFMSWFFCLALGIFCLGAQQLRELYSYILSVGVLLGSYWCNVNFITESKQADLHINNFWKDLSIRNMYQVIFNLSMQISLSQLFILLRTTRKSYKFYQNNNKVQVIFQSFIYISLTLPITLTFFYENQLIVIWSPLLALMVPSLQIMTDFYRTLCFMCKRIYKSFIDAWVILDQRGISDFLSAHWERLHIPKVLRLFFVMRLLYNIAYILYSSWKSNEGRNEENYQTLEYSVEVMKVLLIESCSNIVALMGFTSMVSLVMYYIGQFMSICLGADSEEDKMIGTVSAILFFVLALQTGLTGLNPEERLIRLYRNFCLLSTSVLHFVHGMVNTQLLALSASSSSVTSKHLRALGMCVYLVSFPVCLLIYLWSYHTLNTWLLAVTAFCIEVILKVIFSLLVYALFMIDSYRQVFWEKLDDYVYYVQSTGNTMEFFFGIFLFCNGAWIMLFESGGAIRAVMMTIHAYFNIWLQAKEGWKVFLRRRTAVNKINLLPTATKEQLEHHNDVCSICYQDLQSASITRCNHFFHSVCLRKWLYVQDTCPLCHKNIYPTDDSTKENGQPEQPPQPNHQPAFQQPVLRDNFGAIPLHYRDEPQPRNNNVHLD